MEGYCLTGQSPQWALLLMEEKEVTFVIISPRIFVRLKNISDKICRENKIKIFYVQ